MLFFLACTGPADLAEVPSSTDTPALPEADPHLGGWAIDGKGSLRALDAAGEPELPATLSEVITRTEIQLPEANFPAVQSYCTFEHCSINPRTWHVQLDDKLVVGWTSSSWRAYVSVVEDGVITESFTWDNAMTRGLVADDEGFAALILEDPTGAPVMRLRRLDWDGTERWDKDLNITANEPNLYLDSSGWIGDTRLAYRDGVYAAYFPTQTPDGHHGDQLTLYDDDGDLVSGGWSWGCSHSKGALLEHHPATGEMLPVCVSDTYPSYGIVSNASTSVVIAGSAENGLVSTALGQLADTDDGWLLAFNAMERPCCDHDGIGLIELDTSGSPMSDVVWITETSGVDERDPVFARLGQDRYLLGWRNTATDQFPLMVVDRLGQVLLREDDVLDDGIFWGRRGDDSFQANPDGSITWTAGVNSYDVLFFYELRL